MKKIIGILLIGFVVVFSSCQKDGVSADVGGEVSNTGQGGSMARFTVVDNYLYTVDVNNLHIYDVTDANNPISKPDISIDWAVETIFSYGNNLLIGTQNGVKIFSLDNPAKPRLRGNFTHITACDPVVAQDDIAYSTIRTETWCGNNTNALFILDISDIDNIQLINQYEQQIESPKGLGVKGDLLYVCDEGLKIFNIQDPTNIDLIRTLSIDAWDVIPLDDVLLVIGEDGLYQYSYVGDDLELLSLIPVSREN